MGGGGVPGAGGVFPGTGEKGQDRQANWSWRKTDTVANVAVDYSCKELDANIKKDFLENIQSNETLHKGTKKITQQEQNKLLIVQKAYNMSQTTTKKKFYTKSKYI